MALNLPTPAEISERNIAYDKANNPFYHQRRFEIQLHKGNERRNFYFPRWEVVELILKTIKPEDRNGPDRVIVSDGRDTCIRVLEWERCWYGYKTSVRRGVAIGQEPRF